MLLRIVIAVMAMAGAAAAEERPPPALTAKEMAAGLAPVDGEIRRCYLDAAARVRGSGKLDVKLVVHSDGSVQSVDVVVDGPGGHRARQIGSCVRDLVRPLAFPPRRDFTTGVVPYVFHRARAPHAGPQHSCWRARGCRAPG